MAVTGAGAPATRTVSTEAPRPKSPPAYPDFCGRHRLQVEVQVLNREIGFLQEELHSLEELPPASRCCKEVNEYTGSKSDPLIPMNRKKHKSCRFWRWIRVNLCLNFSWLCCSSRCSCKFRKPACCCNPFKNCCSNCDLHCCDCKCTHCCCSDLFKDCQCKCSSCCCWDIFKCCRCKCSDCCCCDIFKCCRCKCSNCCCWDFLKQLSCCIPCCGLPCCSCPKCSCTCPTPSCSCPKCSCPKFSCPKCSCGCVFSCPTCTDTCLCLCPKCTRPCCVSRCLCP